MTRFSQDIRAAAQRGVGLVELMVAIIIGAVVSLAVFGVVSSFEGRKRTTTSVNDINQSSNYALYRIDKWVRSAGSGFAYGMDNGVSSNRSPYGCQLYATHSSKGQLLPRAAALPAPFTLVNTGTANVFRLLPILIAPGQTTPSVSGQASDVLIVMAGTAGNSAIPMSFPERTAITGTNIPVPNTVGFSANDLLFIADDSIGSSGPCFIEQVASGFASTGIGTSITMGGVYYAATFASGNTPTSFAHGAVANIGNVSGGSPPYFVVIGVGADNVLFSYDLLKSNTASEDDAATPIAEGVFELHALYGIDSNDDNVIDTWVSPSDAASNYTLAKLSDTSDPKALETRIRRIKAVRIGLIMRTALPEKTSASLGFVANTSISLFDDLGATLTYTRAFTTAERAFRYRKVETTIPLRNNLITNSVTPS